MIRSRLGTVLGVAVVATASAQLLGPPAGAETAAARPGPVVRSVGQIARQDVAPAARLRAGHPGGARRRGLAPDPRIAVAVAHDGRYPGRRCGRHLTTPGPATAGSDWRHAPMPDMTKAVGGDWDLSLRPGARLLARMATSTVHLAFTAVQPTAAA